MSWLSKATGIHIKVPGLAQVGGVVDKGINAVAPLAKNPLVDAGLGILTGGMAIPALVGGLGGLASKGGNLGSALSGAAGGALAGGAGNALGGALGLGGGGLNLSGLLKNIPGIGGILSGLTGGGAGGGVANGGLSLSNLADLGLGGASAYNAAQLQGKANQYAQNAMDTANQSYGSRAPLRTAGVQGMLNPGAGVDLSGVRTVAGRGNPFAAGGIPIPPKVA